MSLSDKQREVLDLLIQHKTSKQIARLLGISPHTVDQRITAARRKFAAASRNELAAAYARANAASEPNNIYGKPVYLSSHVANTDEPTECEFGSGSEELAQYEASPSSDQSGAKTFRVVPKAFEGRHGHFWRFSAIAGVTLMFLIAILVGVAIFAQLSDLLR